MAQLDSRHYLKRKKSLNDDMDSDQENVRPCKRTNYLESSDDLSNLSPTKCTTYTTDSSDGPEDCGFVPVQDRGLRTPHGNRRESPFLTPRGCRSTPLPHLPWADRAEMWKVMLQDDEMSSRLRDSQVWEKNPALMPRMRSILLDWLSEVCEVYRLHRSTYFLAIDYIDRYLTKRSNLPKNQLQLLGITCLFIAAKVEEIYPPKLSEFSYVTDGACNDTEILMKEVVVLRELNWELTSMTINYWLCLFMQIYIHKTETDGEQNENAFVYPQYSAMDYETACRVCTLAAWDDGMFQFSYGVIAAAALYYIWNRETALSVSGMSWKTLHPCVEWMYPFATIVKENTGPVITGIAQKKLNSRSGLTKAIPNILNDETHTIQIHNVDLEMFDRARTLPPRTPCKNTSVDTATKNVMLTPPTSGRKTVESQVE